jgi:hypothetical protein
LLLAEAVAAGSTKTNIWFWLVHRKNSTSLTQSKYKRHQVVETLIATNENDNPTSVKPVWELGANLTQFGFPNFAVTM